MITDEDRAAVHAVSEAVVALNKALSNCSDLGIDVEFSKMTTLGFRNDNFIISYAGRTVHETIAGMPRA
ncbi:hypothetical protein [Bradyrhizobium elkanii]|uniref:hypothetical protein n=1 Tax=Bradyrhizobium elkanii TaxID=29448 RepID=UPI00272AD92F|nr:hypothetical protein [Bradyrhizobium elkanii]WLA80319.1 hypothetical protein QNJ99_33780 [Bradyrhizobium elkanii]